MRFTAALQRLVPTVLRGPVRNYLDARAWRLQPSLKFDGANLRCVSDLELTSAMNDPAIGAAFAEDHAGIAGVFGAGEIAGGVNPGDRRALYHLIGYFKPRRVLEIGTHVGASTVHIACALRRFVDQGSLCTADIIDVNGPEGAWRSLGMRQPPSGIMSDLGLEPITTFITGPAAAVLESSGQRFDMIFLDGDHSRFAVYREISAALRLLNPNGLILLHDFYSDGKPLVPDGNVELGPAAAASRIESETDALAFLPLGNLPWPTKNGGNGTSLALASKR
ncbi:MAG: class I SAM-dependent methyltransferase [Bradyrhizobium sp.]